MKKDFVTALKNIKLRNVICTIVFVISMAVLFGKPPGGLKRFITFFAVTTLISILILCCIKLWVAFNRYRGIYPQKGRESNDDVKRLALSGRKILAARVYGEITNADAKEATKEVDKIIAANKQ